MLDSVELPQGQLLLMFIEVNGQINGLRKVCNAKQEEGL